MPSAFGLPWAFEIKVVKGCSTTTMHGFLCFAIVIHCNGMELL